MARIRTIKPEFFTSPDTAHVSHAARLLYIAMWSWADDHGRGELNAMQLRAFAFPEDDPWLDWALDHPAEEAPAEIVGNSDGERRKFMGLLAEVVGGFGIVVFEHRGRKFYEIPTWSKHQRTERTAKERHPRSDDPDSVIYQDFSRPPRYPSENVGNSDATRRKPSEAPQSSGPGTGNIGTGNREQEGVTEAREGTTAREASDPPPPKPVIPEAWIDNPGLARCHKHATDEYPPPCGGCATAREAAEAAQDDRDAERRSAAATRRQTITACSLCDDTGQIVGDNGAPLAPSLACTHDEDANAEIILAAHQRAEAEAAAEAERRDRAAKAAAQARELRARLAQQRTSA